ncbi:YjbH domain-containing protein [Rhodobacter capsulatus]|uniref:Exopolysaccharide biosynthesis protein YbjH n=1 Tax=Rhodobacter capsulatus TaxID=1061 RepID=A0A1G7PAM3_RHOCA|nr:YjbH domain-containing protein [Rhodobacter capsulatus]WER08149.1 YjbH domain-containing protein [Rhodobacter capsulatus]SDF82520.1 Exopolysaccharide biosynthesis protein YbjH [Rhodobacter capsulatus]
MQTAIAPLPQPGKSGLGRWLSATSLVVLAATLGAAPALADPLLGKTRNTFGMPGVLDMPSAEMFPDGELAVGVTALDDGTTRGTLTFQIAPHLVGAFRYSRAPGLMPLDDGPGYEALYDRSFDIRWQMLEEGQWRPAVAVGLNDFVGTGVYSSEYIVATKSIGDRLRVTGGLGWGRLGSKGSIGSFGTRPDYDYSSNGGQFNGKFWFRGDVAPFFGLSYAMTDRLTLKAEYSSDAYVQETKLGDWDQKSALNIGADYQLGAFTHLQLFYMHGDKFGFQITRAINPQEPPFASGIERAPLPVQPRPPVSADRLGWSGAWSQDPTAQPAIQGALAQALEKDGQVLESMSLSATRAELRIRNMTYGAQPQAIGHAARTATRALPPSVETITITSVERGLAISSVTFHRRDLERLENTRALDILPATTITAADAHDPAQVRTADLYPRFRWGLMPYAEASIFDPDNPLRADFGAQLSAKFELAPGFVMSGLVRQKVAGNLDNSTRVSDSEVQHVRSDLVEYQREGDLALQYLTVSHYGQPMPNVFSRVTVGYLERMYGGVSGEMLWKPVDSRLALGLEANWVKQRDFDQHFGFQDYDTATGHVSAYYDFGRGYVGELHVGRYLAQDWGGTIELDREFENGWKVGAFATITDMSSEEYGEGSFDKGIRLTIPVAWSTGKPSVNTLKTTIRPLQRDGGARLDIDGRLFDTVHGAQTGSLYNEWGRFWR